MESVSIQMLKFYNTVIVSCMLVELCECECMYVSIDGTQSIVSIFETASRTIKDNRITFRGTCHFVNAYTKCIYI